MDTETRAALLTLEHKLDQANHSIDEVERLLHTAIGNQQRIGRAIETLLNR